MIGGRKTNPAKSLAEAAWWEVEPPTVKIAMLQMLEISFIVLLEKLSRKIKLRKNIFSRRKEPKELYKRRMELAK